MNRHDLATPALIVDVDALQYNLATMSAVLSGSRLRPHVKAHKTTALAAEQARHGHVAFTCATPREIIGMAGAGLGSDLLLANETLDSSRLEAMAALRDNAMVTVAVDSEPTIDAAAAAGIGHVLIDVNIGLPRCGCGPDDAGRLADLARRRGLEVRGVMGYEGHLMMVPDTTDRRAKVAAAVDLLMRAHGDVGGDVVSSGGTGTFDLHDRATEIQAGSYALMDTQYGSLDLPFRQAIAVWSTVISTSPGWAVCDTGLKSLGMDHGNPSIDGHTVWFCSDEHITFAPADGTPAVSPGDHVMVTPAHIDPTMALHECVYLVRGDEVVDRWAIDLRGW